MKKYLIKLGDAASQFFNVLLFNGDPNYSISGDAHRLGRKRLEKVIDTLLSPFEPRHCYWAYVHDVQKARILVNEASHDS